MKTLGYTAGGKRKSQSLESPQQKSSGTEATGRHESSFSTEENPSPIVSNICLRPLHHEAFEVLTGLALWALR